METKPKYNVMQGNSLSEIIEKVNRMIEMGWLPLGGICTLVEEGDHRYYQAMSINLGK